MVKSYAEILALQSRMEALCRLVVLMLTLAFLLAVMLLFTSCEHKELLTSTFYENVTVRFLWDRVPHANPDGMVLVAFAPSAQTAHVPFADKNGGTAVFQEGTYQFVAYNDNTETLQMAGSDWESFSIAALPTTIATFAPMFAKSRALPRASGTESQEIIHQPDNLWYGAHDAVNINGDESMHVDMVIKQATREFRFNIMNVENLSYVSDIVATLSGMSGSITPATDSYGTPECLIPFTLSAIDATTLSGSLRTFNNVGSITDDASHMLTLYIQMVNGQKFYSTYNVTKALAEAVQQSDGSGTDGEIDITVKDLPIPKPITNGSGFQPDVDIFEEIAISIDLGL